MDNFFDCKRSGFEDYQFNWNGEVMNKQTGKLLKKQIDKYGKEYTQVKSKFKFYVYQIRKDISINHFGVSDASRFF